MAKIDWNNILFFSIGAILLGVSGVGCGEIPLKKLLKVESIQLQKYSVAEVEADFCTMDPDKIKTNTKMLFVIDRSGSNADTDPDKTRRFQAILDYLDKTETDRSIYYNLITFGNGSSAKTFLEDFTNDKEEFKQVVTNEYTSGRDDGNTPYKAALGETFSAINGDIIKAKKDPSRGSSVYVVFFISDGQPTDDSSPYDDIIGAETSIMDLGKNNPEYVEGISIHTGLYYTPTSGRITAAVELLSKMAQIGQGEFKEFGKGEKIDYDTYKIPERQLTIGLQDLFVQNVSTTWWNGKLVLDSDTDGVPDEEEFRLGSDPSRKDSDGNGVTDAVEYAVYGKPCQSSSCSESNARKFKECDGFVENPNPSAKRFRDTDKDLLNDCEEVLLGSKFKEGRDWDSNGDWIPDPLAFAFGMSLLPTAADASSMDPDWDNVNNYQEIKRNSPTSIPNDKLLGLKPYEYSLTTTSSSHNKSCYELSVKNIMYIGDSNLIRIFLEQTTRVGKDARYLSIVEKRLAKDATVRFFEKDFK